MTDTPTYIAPQSATAPITTNLQKDELASLQTANQDVTSDQRIAAIGNTIPLVFTKQAGSIGGVWVTPPAVRYGAEVNDVDGDSFAFATVVSDGCLPSIPASDVWKGQIQLNTLSDFAAVTSCGSLPTTGFDYTFGSVITIVEDFSVAEENKAYSFSGNSYSITIQGCTAFSFTDTRIRPSATSSLNYFHRWQAFADGVSIGGSGATESTGFSESFSFENPVTFVLTVSTSFTNYWPNPAFLVFSTISYDYTTTSIVSAPTIPGAPSSLPLFPGDGGTFEGMTILAVKGRYAVEAEPETYKEQIRCFVRNGVEVASVLNDEQGSSNNFADLVFYLLNAVGKVSSQLIDKPSFVEAHSFTTKNNLYFNGVLANSVNLVDYITRVAPLFLLRFGQVNGKYTLRPVLPLDIEFNISLDPVTAVASFDASNIVAGTYRKSYIDTSRRKPFCALVTWRSQSETTYGTSKTNEIRYANTAVDGPFEQYDLEEFCTNEDHAVTIGKYIIASRKHTTHTVSFQTTDFITSLQPADIIQIAWSYGASVGNGEESTTFYQVDSISEGVNGQFQVEATHFPTTATSSSQVALDMLVGI